MHAGANQVGKELYEFGPFQVNPEKEILLRAGEPVQLTPKTFQILLVLVRHSNELVSKEDLMKTVWPDTFVEEANLSRNIFLLRKALGERPQDHRYVVTVPGRGYRFAEKVNLIADEELSIVAADHSKVEVEVEETRPWGWIALAGILVVAVAAGGFWFLGRRSLGHDHPGVLSKTDTLVLADFANSTGEPVFDGALRSGISAELEQSPFLSLVSEQHIQHTLRLMGRPPDTRLTPEVAREICERLGSTAVLEGSITRLGSQYVLGLRAKACRTGDVLDEEQVQAAKKEDVLNALNQIAGKFRRRVGESLAGVNQHSTPLAEASTPSLEALKAYSTAWQVWFASGPAATVAPLQHAIELDPQFAMAHAFLGRVYGELWEPVLAAESSKRAYELRNRVSDVERFFITVPHDLDVMGNLEQGEQTAAVWAETYPRDVRPRGYLSWIDQDLGRYEQSVEDGKKAIALDPDFPPGYNNLAWAYVQLDRVPEAENTLAQAEQHNVAFPEFLVMRYYIDFLKGDRAAMEREAAHDEGNPDVGDWILHEEATTLAYSGRLREARERSRRAVNSAREGIHKEERAAMWEAGAAVREAFLGSPREARQHATAAVTLSKGRDAEYGAALAFALVGDEARSQALAKDMEKSWPEDTLVRFNYLPTLRALAALRHGDASGAVAFLEPAAPYELSVGGASGFFGLLYPVYVRGQAYLFAHRYAEAAAQFQRIVDHPGIVFADPVGAHARLELGRSYALAGDRLKAKSAYQDFLALWKDADPDIPMLKQAKVEYAKLQ
jgi:eukaryotic-like serine/threonine-protein kinase